MNSIQASSRAESSDHLEVRPHSESLSPFGPQMAAEIMVKTVGQMFDSFPENRASEATILAFSDALKNLPHELLRHSVAKAIIHETFTPKVTTILRYAALASLNLPSANDQAEMAIKGIRRGRWEGIEIHGLARDAIKSLGGLRTAESLNESETGNWLARFRKAFEAECESAVMSEMERLAGG